MNDFENKIMNEYVKNHALALLREAAKTAANCSDIADVQLVREHEMLIASMYRVMYLSLKEYHNSLSQRLAEHGISLPDLDTLVSEEILHQD